MYSLHPDGQRVAIAAVPESTGPQNTAVFVFNFFDELRRRPLAARFSDRCSAIPGPWSLVPGS